MKVLYKWGAMVAVGIMAFMPPAVAHAQDIDPLPTPPGAIVFELEDTKLGPTLTTRSSAPNPSNPAGCTANLDYLHDRHKSSPGPGETGWILGVHSQVTCTLAPVHLIHNASLWTARPFGDDVYLDVWKAQNFGQKSLKNWEMEFKCKHNSNTNGFYAVANIEYTWTNGQTYYGVGKSARTPTQDFKCGW